MGKEGSRRDHGRKASWGESRESTEKAGGRGYRKVWSSAQESFLNVVSRDGGSFTYNHVSEKHRRTRQERWER